jgi:tRNA(Ile)-lysidine synthase
VIDVIRERVAAALAALGVADGEPVAVACSGGPDSMVLAHAIIAQARPVVLIHVDHQLRADSAADAERVRALGAAGGARVEVETVTVDRRGSLEAAARQVRYAALALAADRAGVRWILTAHTADDQAETVLMRLIRGTGIAGLAGIPRRRGRYVRPLLDTWRREVADYAAAAGLDCADDPMNRDPRFLRSQVRHKILPALRARQPEIDRQLVRMAEAAGQQAALLDIAAGELLTAGSTGTDRWESPAAALAAAPAPVARRALALAATGLGGGPLSAVHLDVLVAMAQRAAHGTRGIDLPGLRGEREYGTLRLRRPLEPQVPAALSITGPYTVRTWQPGDRMRPARLRGRSRKLSDLFIDAKVPRSLRATARVVIADADGTIVWAEHIGPSFDSPVEVTLTYPDPGASNKSRRG